LKYVDVYLAALPGSEAIEGLNGVHALAELFKTHSPSGKYLTRAFGADFAARYAPSRLETKPEHVVDLIPSMQHPYADFLHLVQKPGSLRRWRARGTPEGLGVGGRARVPRVSGCLRHRHEPSRLQDPLQNLERRAAHAGRARVLPVDSTWRPSFASETSR